MKKQIFLLATLLICALQGVSAQAKTYEWKGVGLSFKSPEKLDVNASEETVEYEASCDDYSLSVQIVDREDMDTPASRAKTLKEMADDAGMTDIGEVSALEGMDASLTGCIVNGAMEDEEDGGSAPITLLLLVPAQGDDAFLVELSYDDDAGDAIDALIRSFNYNDAKNSRKDRE